MKKFLLVLTIFIMASIAVRADIDCSDVHCPPGMQPGETGWVWMKMGYLDPPTNNEPFYCLVKVCYCSNFNAPSETANVWIAKIIYADPDCAELGYNVVTLKNSILEEIIRTNQDLVPFWDCRDGWKYYINIWTAECYTTVYVGELESEPYAIMECITTGYCCEQFRYCWDTSDPNNWELIIQSMGYIEEYLPLECEPPDPYPPYSFGPCIYWCGEE